MTSRHLKTLSCSLFAGALESMVRIEIRSSQLRAIILTRGATLAELHASDRSGRCGDVLLGFSTEEGWACAANPCMGCIIGRVAGRTCPDLTVDAVEYKLPGCDGGGGGIRPSTNLHGGLRLSRQEWRVTENSADAVVLQAICIGRDCGFPGDVACSICYRIDGPQLRMSYTATCTATTPVSLTNHSYFNLSAGSDSTVFNHMLQLACDAYAPDDGSGDGLPTGRFVSVEGTSRDLRGGRPLSEVITDQARLSPHWPHGEEFVVAANRGLNSNAVAVACEHKLPPFAAQLWHPPSGRCVRVYTSEPALQTYYGTLLSNTGHVMKNGHSYGACAGVCLETQRHANAEATGAPSRLLRKGEVYRQETVLVFSAQ